MTAEDEYRFPNDTVKFSINPHLEGPPCIVDPRDEGRMVVLITVPHVSPETTGWETVAAAAGVMEEALGLVAEKSFGYGEAWREQGWMGNVARIMSKTSRLKNMLWRDNFQQRSDAKESAEDTFLDLLNLSAFAILNRRNRNQWGR